MTLQEEAQKKAQAEIDAVIGTDRVPTPGDREHLPYCEALLTEVLRVYTFGPLGESHRLASIFFCLVLAPPILTDYRRATTCTPRR